MARGICPKLPHALKILMQPLVHARAQNFDPHGLRVVRGAERLRLLHPEMHRFAAHQRGGRGHGHGLPPSFAAQGRGCGLGSHHLGKSSNILSFVEQISLIF